jgi:hypothetical protein
MDDSKTDELTEGWRKLRNKESHDFCSASKGILYCTKLIKTRRMKWAERFACVEKKTNAYIVLHGNAERNTKAKMKRQCQSLYQRIKKGGCGIFSSGAGVGVGTNGRIF